MSLQQVNFPSLRRVKSTPVAATPPTITRPNNSTHHHAQNCVTLDGYSRVATVSLGFSESDNIVFSLLKYFSRFCAMPLVFRAYFVTFLVVIRDTFRLTKSSSQVCVCVCVCGELCDWQVNEIKKYGATLALSSYKQNIVFMYPIQLLWGVCV